MRKALLLGPALLAACAASQADPPISGAGGSVCRGPTFPQFAGREATSAAGAELLRVSGARVIRWARPGAMMTMDYREDRLTVRVDAQNRIVSATCG